MAGSKPRLTEEARKAFVDALAHGLSINKAGALARIPPTTVDRWLQKGREALAAWAEACEALADDDPVPALDVYGDFFLDAAEAIAQRELGWLKKLEASEEKSAAWQRYAWLLERTNPGDYALKEGISRVALAAGGGKAPNSEVALDAVALILVQAGVAGAAGAARAVLDQAAEDRPRAALPAAGEVLAEPVPER